jgi:hypothetical protein
LFVPVSGPFGMGEYARSLTLAHGFAQRWPAAQIRFVLSEQAPYAASTVYPTTLLKSSPTFHSAAVAALIEEFRPDVVIFDNAGRTAQLRAARRAGARLVFISSRRRQRRKAFRFSWAALLDEHWIAYPEFIAGRLNFLERLKQRVSGGPAVRYLDVILDARRPAAGEPILSRLKLEPDEFVLVVPGGGTGHPGAVHAVDEFARAAQALAAAGVATVLVGAPPGLESVGALTVLGSLPQFKLGILMRSARLVVANGGSTLLQAIACGKATLGIPIAGDQAERLQRCRAAGVALAAPLEAAVIEREARGLWDDTARREALAGRAIALGLADGVDVALRAVGALLVGR